MALSQNSINLLVNLDYQFDYSDLYKRGRLYQPMSDRIFRCGCQKCGADFEFTGSYEKFNEFMNSTNFICQGGHTETRSPRGFLKIIMVSEPQPILEWKPSDGRNYVNILDYERAHIEGMQMDHLGSGLYIDRRTRKKYDYEEDSKGNRHYFEIPA